MIVAVDFDDTITYPSPFPITGKIRPEAVKTIKSFQALNIQVILWTCRSGQYLEEAINLCNEHGIYFDAINDNIKDINSRKILADVYVDDKNLNKINWKQIKRKVLKLYKQKYINK